MFQLPSRIHGSRARGRTREPHRAVRAASRTSGSSLTGEGGFEISTMLEDRDLTTFLEDAENDGVVDTHTLDALATELDLDEDELALLRAELEAREVEIAPAEG